MTKHRSGAVSPRELRRAIRQADVLGLRIDAEAVPDHSGRAAFEDDRDRDLKLKAIGYEVLRLSYRQVVDEPARVAEVLAGLLGPTDYRPSSA